MDWDEHATGWDDDPAVRAYAAAAYAALDSELALRGRSLQGQRALDFGCGTGVLTEALASKCAQVVGLDPAPKMAAVLRNKIDTNRWDHVRAVTGELELLRSHESGPFDLVVCSSVCAFLPDYPGTVAQLAALLAPGGAFVQFDWEFVETDPDPFGLTKAGITAALEGAGLHAVRVHRAFECEVDGKVMNPLMGSGQRPED